MKLNVRAIVIAEAAVAGILFVLCRLAFTLAPDTMLAGMRYLFHTDWSGIAVPMTWGGFFLGLVVFTVFVAVVGAATATGGTDTRVCSAASKLNTERTVASV